LCSTADTGTLFISVFVDVLVFVVGFLPLFAPVEGFLAAVAGFASAVTTSGTIFSSAMGNHSSLSVGEIFSLLHKVIFSEDGKR
jgi:hypothetical protein